jgi:hypothetical protein
MAASTDHRIRALPGGRYECSWLTAGSSGSRLTDRAGATRFAKRWGCELPADRDLTIYLGAACAFGAHEQCRVSRCQCPCHTTKEAG